MAGSPAIMDRLMRIRRWATSHSTSWRRFAERLLRRPAGPLPQRSDGGNSQAGVRVTYISPKALRQIEREVERIIRRHMMEARRARAEVDEEQDWMLFNDDPADDAGALDALAHEYEPQD
jgi:hypothetical protein